MPQNSNQQATTFPQATLAGINAFFVQVYGWMAIGLGITAVVAGIIGTNYGLLEWIVRNDWVLPVIFLLELVVVIGISAFGSRMNSILAVSLFSVYAVMNGLFFGVLFGIYTGESLLLTFGMTAGVFAFLAVYGLTTKSDLTKIGTLAYLGLFAAIIVSVINIFAKSSGLQWVISFALIAIFIVLIAYDSQRLKRLAAQAEAEGRVNGLAIVGALTLYLDFINLFIQLLRIFGKRR